MESREGHNLIKIETIRSIYDFFSLCNCRLFSSKYLPNNLSFVSQLLIFLHLQFRSNFSQPKQMIRNSNFQARKRKWKPVLFLLRKRKRKDDEEPHHDVNIVQVFEGNKGNEIDDDSRRHTDTDHGGSDGFDADERDENPFDENPFDEKIEGFENENPSFDHDLKTKETKEEEEETSKSALLIVSERKKYGGAAPPDDDCCPICFEDFSIACKTNCGHWFCASCILQFWTYKTALQKCNCPICARPITELTPEASLSFIRELEVIEVLKNVQRYNRLFQGGVSGVIWKVFEAPSVFGRMLSSLMDPDNFRVNYYAMRVFALLMSCIYNISSFDFIPTGNLGVRRLFDLCAIALVVILCLIGVCHRLVLRRRVRRLAATQL